MALVEGIGDEVIYVIGGTLILIVLLFAWYSTFVSEQPVFRASVFVIERRRTNSNSNSTESTRRVIVTTSSYQSPTVTTETISTNSTSNHEQTTNQDQQQSATTTHVETIESNNDEVSSVSTNLTAAETKEETENQLRQRIRPNEPNNQTTETQAEQESTPSETVDSSSEGNIRIRLVFLNDTQRLVEAKLDDRLGQFKQKHFREELANHRVVRLIYNGQLLQGDQETLQYYGLSDNCVVHCHISSTTIIPPPNPSFSNNSSDLDLGRLMLPLFGLILGLIWCCRMQYRQYFNTASTFALVGITGLFVVSVFSVGLTARNRMRARRQ